MFFREFLDDDIENNLLVEDLEGQKAQRADFIKQKYAEQWHGLPGYETIDAFVEKLGEVDPTRNGAYMPWLAKLAILKPGDNRAEDLDRVGEDLRHFETNKSRIANRDIGQYKSFQDLFDVIAPFLVPKEMTADEKAKQKEAERLAKIKDQIITVYNGPEGWIRIPTSAEAAKFLGQNTRWCTAAERNNMFSHYNGSDVLFVIYDKQSKKRNQLHIDSGQFADEADRNQGIDTVPQWARQPLVDYYKANNPNLSLRHIMSLTKFTDENLAKGTDHEDLINLMKEYGI